MSWLDSILDRAQEAKGRAPKPAAPRAVAKPRAKHEIKLAWFQTALPRNGDCGAVEAVHYYVADGSVTLCGEDGRPTNKTAPLPEGAEAKTIAARMGRAAWLASDRGSDFSRRLEYELIGIA